MREVLQESIRLEEIVNPSDAVWLDDPPAEAAFRKRRFRPIVERKTDISFAHEILRKATKRVNA